MREKLMEHIRQLITDLAIPEMVDNAVREEKPSIKGFDLWSLEQMIDDLMQEIGSEIIYNIDLWRQETQYGERIVPEISDKVREALLNAIKYKKYPDLKRVYAVSQKPLGEKK